MKKIPGHFVAIIGGAVAGAEAAARLSERGIYTVVFDQNERPYGKIDDGLPKWHVKLQAQEERKIDGKLSEPNVFFVPKTKLGRDLDFQDLVDNWGFSAILLANGAWRDRPLPVEGVDDYVDRGLIYQNPLVFWFNHYHESNYKGKHLELADDAIVVGGGLASLDVVKILMLETVLPALRERGINIDVLTLEHKTIATVLDENNLTLKDLGLNGCTLYYRRRIIDMPLAQLPPDATPERAEKVYQSRKKILANFQRKFLFNFAERRFPSGTMVENGRLAGLKFVETEIVDGQPAIKEGKEYEVRSPLVISSIGSIPAPIPGIDLDGELFDIVDLETGRLRQYKNVFALGNVVTGQGNIKASLMHGRQVSEHVMDSFLAWRAEDYEELLNRSVKDTQSRILKISDFLNKKRLLDADKINSIINKIRAAQTKVSYNGNYQDWIDEHKLEKIDEVIRIHAAA